MHIRLPPDLVGWFGAAAARLLARTMRVVREAEDPRWAFPNPERPRAIWAFWHGRILLVALSHLDTGAFIPISRHRDGEYVAKMGLRVGVQPIRGSTRRGGVRALKTMVRVARGADIAVTPDGPRGPRYVVQPGIIHLARLAGRPIVPGGVEASPAWLAPSWDQFTVPSPFGRLAIVYGTPLEVPRDLDDRAVERTRTCLEGEMHRLTARARAIATGAA